MNGLNAEQTKDCVLQMLSPKIQAAEQNNPAVGADENPASQTVNQLQAWITQYVQQDANIRSATRRKLTTKRITLIQDLNL